ncbi:MAG: hypothetical protein LYZ70_00920 [Nitrososphaerales archaeon]|nr:hypothetical protein [Nitrososphaerales archaeon]
MGGVRPRGPESGTVASYLDGPSPVLTPASVVAGLNEAMLRNRIGRRIARQVITLVKSRSVVVALDADLAERTGELNHQRKKKVKGWGMLDAFVYSLAVARRGRVGTGDPHFSDLKGAVQTGT